MSKQEFDTTQPGWRIQQLRLKRGMAQRDLAVIAQIDPAFLNKIERGTGKHSRPKAVTVTRLLDALNATPAERDAVAHIESPPIPPEQIAGAVEAAEGQFGNIDEPVVLFDVRGVRRYMNPTARLLYRIPEDRYPRAIGEHALLSYIDPESPLYRAYYDAERLLYFSQRLHSFMAACAPVQFDKWYLSVLEKVRALPLGRQALEAIDQLVPPVFLMRQDIRLVWQDGTPFLISGQANILMSDPNFMIATHTPLDSAAREVFALVSRPT